MNLEIPQEPQFKMGGRGRYSKAGDYAKFVRIKLFPGVKKNWRLRFQINQEPVLAGRPAGSLSWAGLANFYYWIDPKNSIGGADSAVRRSEIVGLVSGLRDNRVSVTSAAEYLAGLAPELAWMGLT